MDGFYEHLSNMNLTEVTERLKYEQYDTDAAVEDVPIGTNPDLSQSNVATSAVAANKIKAISQYLYETKCMLHNLHL